MKPLVVLALSYRQAKSMLTFLGLDENRARIAIGSNDLRGLDLKDYNVVSLQDNELERLALDLGGRVHRFCDEPIRRHLAARGR